MNSVKAALVLDIDPCTEGPGRPGGSLWCPGPAARLMLLGNKLTFDWGHNHVVGTAAYWVNQASRTPPPAYNLGDSLAEEVTACVLGGHGMPAPIGVAAFRALKAQGLIRFDPPPSLADLEGALREPLVLESGRSVRYRFPRQRARRIAGCLALLAREDPPQGAGALRQWLMSMPGIGPKTASWIVRNRHPRADVAVIDIHVRRAGIAAGFFSAAWVLPRDYSLFEIAFVSVARKAGVSPAVLDDTIWQHLRGLASGRLFAAPGTSGTAPSSSRAATDLGLPQEKRKRQN